MTIRQFAQEIPYGADAAQAVEVAGGGQAEVAFCVEALMQDGDQPAVVGDGVGWCEDQAQALSGGFALGCHAGAAEAAVWREA